MSVFTVSYDLYRGSRSRYESLIEAIKQFPDCLHTLESTWFITTVPGVTAQQVYEYLRPHLDPKDRLLVTPVTIDGGWWSQGLEPKALQWLRAKLSTQAVVRVAPPISQAPLPRSEVRITPPINQLPPRF